MASPISAQQRSAEESREEFDMRMFTMVSQLQTTDSIFFHKLVSKSMATELVQGSLAYSLEFPHDFITHHSKKFDRDVTFLTADSHRTWPIKITVRPFKQQKPRVFAYGVGGWKAFLTDNQIKVGDVLIFNLIGFSRFQVLIGRSPPEVHSDEDQGGNADQGNPDQTPVRCEFCNKLPLWPRFVVTIRRPSEPEHPENHFYLEKDLSLVVPSHFWELHSRMLERDELQLEGPLKTVTMVKVEKTYHNKEVQKVRFMHTGWKAFLLANNLAVGDVLEFSLVANSSFTVDVVERIQNEWKVKWHN